MNIDMNSPVDRVRLAIVDYLDPEVFPDSVIQGKLDAHNGNETATIKEMAMLMLGMLNMDCRQRLDRIELYSNQKFEQYLKYLDKVIKNPMGAYSSAGIYAAGVYVEDVLNNQADTEVVQRRLPIGGENGEYSVLSDEDPL